MIIRFVCITQHCIYAVTLKHDSIYGFLIRAYLYGIDSVSCLWLIFLLDRCDLAYKLNGKICIVSSRNSSKRDVE